MAAKPAHVKIAEEKGLQAGVDAWVDGMETVTKNGTAGLEPVRDLLKRARRAGGYTKASGEFSKPDKLVTFYCNHYAERYPHLAELPDVIAPKRTRKNASKPKAQAEPVSGDANAQALLALLSEAGVDLSSLGITTEDETGVEAFEDDDDDDDTPPARTTRTNRRNTRGGRTKARGSKRSARAEAPDYTPSNPDDAATNGRLWKLNQLGLLQIVDLDEADEDEIITNLEAHEALQEALS